MEGKERKINCFVCVSSASSCRHLDVQVYFNSNFRGTEVPVGEDQKQHIELTRYLAEKFNSEYRINYFTPPEPLIIPETKIFSLKDGRVKMSKSDSNPSSRIELEDNSDSIRKKIKTAKTDLFAGITYDPVSRPDVSNLIRIFSLVTGKDIDKIVMEYGGPDRMAMEFKNSLTDALVEYWNPFHEEYLRLMKSPEYIEQVYVKCEQEANVLSDAIWKEIQETVGLSNQ